MNLDKNNLQIITNPTEWNTLLQEVGNYDFYHTYDYHILEMRIITTKRGMAFFNLGGGLGGGYNDSLFQFKTSFLKEFKDFCLWKPVVN